IGDVRKLGRMGLKTLLFTGVFSTAAVLIGLGLVNTLQPGKSLSAERRLQLVEKYQSASATIQANAGKTKSFADILVDMIPENPLQEMVGAVDGSSKGNGMLAVMVCALIVGLAITMRLDDCRPLVGLLESIQTVTAVIIDFALKLAPVGAGCLVFAI